MDAREYYSQPHINLTGHVGNEMINDLDRQIKSAALELHAPAVVTLATGGGSVGYARAIYEELSLLQKVNDLTFVARGICLSAGVTIAMAFPQERRFATPNTKFLIHQGHKGASPDIIGPLSAREIQVANFLTEVDDDRNESKWVVAMLAKGCGRTQSEVKTKMQSGAWLTGKKAVEFGLINSLIKLK